MKIEKKFCLRRGLRRSQGLEPVLYWIHITILFSWGMQWEDASFSVLLHLRETNPPSVYACVIITQPALLFAFLYWDD